MLAELWEKTRKSLARFLDPEKPVSEPVDREDDEPDPEIEPMEEIRPELQTDPPAAPAEPPTLAQDAFPAPQVPEAQEVTATPTEPPQGVTQSLWSKGLDAEQFQQDERTQRMGARVEIRQAQKRGRVEDAQQMASEERLRRHDAKDFDGGMTFPDPSQPFETPPEPEPEQEVSRRPGLREAARRAASMGDAAVQEMRQERPQVASSSDGESQQVRLLQEIVTVLKEIEGKLNLESRWN